MLLSRLDLSRLKSLRLITGDSLWPEIMAQIETDLRQARINLIAPDSDRNAMRVQTHVLMAVAGTIGGLRVQRLAEVLNTAVHEEGTPTEGLLDLLLQELDQLCRLLALHGADWMTTEMETQ